MVAGGTGTWERLRAGAADDDPALDPASQLALALARSRLREQQRKWPAGAGHNETPLDAALRKGEERRESSALSAGYIRSGKFLYDPDLEEQRWKRTADVIRRADPGEHEDGGLLEQLARQAASVEMYLSSRQFHDEVGDAAHRILLGTTSAPGIHAGSFRVRNAVLLTFSKGLLTMLGVMAHAVVRAHRPLAPEAGYDRWDTEGEAIERHLDEDPTAVNLLQRYLVDWLVKGRVEVYEDECPAGDLVMPYELLHTFAERFVVAHEYSHALVDKLEVAALVGDAGPDVEVTEKEVRADLFAVRTLASTSTLLDGTAPNVALQGAVLAMKAYEVLERARGFGGASPRLKLEVLSHPPFQQRAALCRDVYRWFGRQGGDPFLQVRGMTLPAETVERVWRRAASGIKAAVQADGLHPIWRGI